MTAAWASKALAEVCEIKPPKSEAKRKLDESDVVSFVPMEDLGIDQKFLDPKAERKLGQVAGSYTYFADGDVLLAKITPCFENGKLAIAKGLTNQIGFGSSEYIVFRPREGLSNEFLYYFMLRDSFRAEGARTMSGAVGHRRVSKEFIERCKIPLPSLSEQQRIVKMLDDVFAQMATATVNAEKNLENARELFDSLLISICGKADTDQGWAERQLGDVCDLYQGLAINKGTKHLLVKKSSLPLLRIKDLREGSQEQYVAEEGYPPNARVSPQDLIYTRTGQIGLVFRGRYGVLHNNCFKISPRDELTRGYLFWWLQNPYFRTRITALASRMAQPDITHTIFKAQRILVPPVQYQTEAIEKLENLHAETQRLEAICNDKLKALVELKQSILEKAFSGKLVSRLLHAVDEAAE